MTSVTYGIIKEEYRCGEQCRGSYGIVAYDNVSHNQLASVIASVHDISENRAVLEQLTDLCNQEKLSVLHLQDIVDDFLSQ